VITSSPTAFDIGIEPAASAKDAERVAGVAGLVNAVYEQAESGLWVDGTPRTSGQEIAELIARGQIATARTADRVVGAVRIHELDSDTAEFGMLAADPARRGLGIGRALVGFTERWAVDRGLSFMQLELLVPTTWDHPSKQFLRDWYSRLGYRVVRTGTLEESYPDLAPLLATPCDLLVYRKPLGGGAASG
jgi:GNAT superfamily N-acetyltransferase